jgi:type IV secretion system protein VirB9
MLLVAGLLTAGPALGQVQPQPGSGDPRIQWIDYAPEQVVMLEVAPGYQITVQLAADERIESVAVGDSSAWQVTASANGDHLFVKPLQGGVPTNMTVITSNRLYAFDLVPLPAPSYSMPYAVQFRYASREAQAQEERGAPVLTARYKLSGDRELRPSAISDDGEHTYIEWPDDAALPAVYVLDEHGREVLPNGAMRGEAYVLDSVHSKLIFRLDKDVARARRIVPEADS